MSEKILQGMIDDLMRVPLGEKPKGHGHGMVITIETGKGHGPTDSKAPGAEQPDEDDEKHNGQMAKLHAMKKGF